MTSLNITQRSSKSDILDASTELIGDLDDKLKTEKRLALSMREERNSVAYILVATSVFHLLF